MDAKTVNFNKEALTPAIAELASAYVREMQSIADQCDRLFSEGHALCGFFWALASWLDYLAYGCDPLMEF